MEIRRSRSNSRIPSGNSNPLNKYQIGQMLGQGQFGKVYKAQIKYHKLNNNNLSKLKQETKESAIKIIPVGKIKKNPKLKQLLANQIQILGNLKHQNIIKFQELFTWQDKIYMVYEYCQGGDLEDKLPLPSDQAFDVFYPIVKACSFAEANNILHRDLKPANILFKNGQPKVADWGFSRYLKEQITATSFVGSPAYMAPQLLKGCQYTNKADVWSFGVMLYECLFNQMPWPASTIRDLLQLVNKIPLNFPKQILPILKSIIKLCLQVDPQKRASFKKIQKIMEIGQKNTKTQHQNPEQEINSYIKTQLSTSDIRKCSYYLQFAKQSQRFQMNQAKSLCLQLIINNLKKIKSQNFGNRPIIHTMTPCLSQRMMSPIKKQTRVLKTSSKLTKRNKQEPEACILLQKQINLIQKIRQSFPKYLTESPSKSSADKSLIKQILKKLIKNISISQKSQAIKTSRKQLIQMNCILQIVMFQQLSQQAKNTKLSEKIQQMQELSLSALIRSVNHKILYVNQKYCKI